MFEDDALKIKLYMWVAMFLLLGGAVGMYWLSWLGLALWILAGIIALHVLLISYIREKRQDIVAKKEFLEAQNELYKTVMRMNPEERYIFGLAYTPKEVTVKVNKTNVEQNEYSQIWRKLPVAPYKLKVIAQAMLNGEGFTVRKWAGDDKLLSRSEWDALLEKMLELGLLEWIDVEHPTLGTNWTSLGEDVMTQVIKDTL